VPVRIIVTGLAEASAEVKAAVSAGVAGGLNVAGTQGERLVKETIASSFGPRPPAVATGNLLNSVAFEVVRQADISRVTVFAGPPADVYAGYVETGTRPHFPPPSALLLWVERKFHPGSEKQALSIAFAIARTIAKRGTSAFRMFDRAFTVLEGQLGGIFEAAIARAIEAAGVGKV
jgi:hypothetical protein